VSGRAIGGARRAEADIGQLEVATGRGDDQGPRLWLLCFPQAGGSSSTFRTWPAALPASIAVSPIRLPGRRSRAGEPLIGRVPPLVDLLVDEILPRLSEPFVLFGHGVGALVAFEVARALRAGGTPEPVAVYVSAFRAPHLPPSRAPIHSLPDDLFLHEVRRIGEGVDDLLADVELRQLVLPVLRADIELGESYRYIRGAPLSCPVRVFGGRGDASVRRQELAGWRRHTLGPFRMAMFPGDHWFVHTARPALLRFLREDLRELVPGIIEEAAPPRAYRRRHGRSPSRPSRAAPVDFELPDRAGTGPEAPVHHLRDQSLPRHTDRPA
jgi:medium-chain acyl-[acyl-carrier-protein] hydrolase